MMNFIKAHRWSLGILAVIIIAIGGYVVYQRQHKVAPELVASSRRSLIAAVTVTGQVTSANETDLSFQSGGKVSRLYVDAGAHVKAGQVLAELDDASQHAAVAQAEAALAVQQANLAQVQSGTRPEQLAVTATQESNAEQAVADAKTNLANVNAKAEVDLSNAYDAIPNLLNSAYLNADDAVTNQLNALFTGVDSNNPQLSYITSDAQAQLDAEAARQTMKMLLPTFLNETNTLPSDDAGRDAALVTAIAHLHDVSTLLDNVAATLNVPTNLSPTTLATYKGYVNVGRTNVNTSITALTNEQHTIASQLNTNQNAIATATTQLNDATQALAVAKGQLDLQKAGSTPDQIASAKAQVGQAEANVQSAEAALDFTIIKAPIDGVITKRDTEIGESAAPNAPILSMIADTQLEIDANVPEVDIGKVKVGNPVDITLDAYPGQTFQGSVTYIDPAETDISGVVNYKVKVAITNNAEQFKSGLTANLSIETDRKDNALALPQYAIIENDQGTFVRKLKADGTTQDVPVTIGLRSEDGYVEILSGLNDGESVVNIGAKSGS